MAGAQGHATKGEEEVVEEVGVLPATGKGLNAWWLVFGALMLANFGTRLHKVDQPAWVCWDETHFGKMASWYINRSVFATLPETYVSSGLSSLTCTLLLGRC